MRLTEPYTMMDRHDLLSRMRQALADLYDDQMSATRIAEDAGLDAARIERADRAVNFWYSILREAERQEKMDALLAVAIKEYPARADLAELRDEYRSLSVARRETPSLGSGPGQAPAIERPSKPAPGLWWLLPAVGALVAVIVLVLATTRGRLPAVPANTGANTVTAFVTQTSGSPAAGSTGEPAAAVAESPAPTSVSPAEIPGCFGSYFSGVSNSRVTILEPGATDFDLPQVDLALAEPIGYLFTHDGQPIGAMRFRFVTANQFFRVESIVDSRCEKIESYANASRSGDKHILQLWDTLQLTLGSQGYDLRMGVWSPEGAPDQPRIRVDFGETAPS